VSEGQSGAAALDDDLRGSGAMSLGTMVDGVSCDAETDHRAYCMGTTLVECIDAQWRSIVCPTGQFCGELMNANVGCYSQTSNDPDVTADPVDAGSADDAARATCPDFGGAYAYTSRSGSTCTDQGAVASDFTINVENGDCRVTLDAPLMSRTFFVSADGTCTESACRCSGGNSTCHSVQFSGGCIAGMSGPCVATVMFEGCVYVVTRP
jgi:hypothetical protein